MAVAYEIAPCIVCGAAAGRELASADEMKREVEWLWEFHGRRLRPDTPPERLTDRLAFSQRPPLRLAQCTRCGLIYRNPRERAHELEEIYGEAAVDPGVLETLFRSQRRAQRGPARRLGRVAGRPGRGLEVGCYTGAFLEAAGELGWSFEGIDISTAAVRFAAARGLRARAGTLADAAGARSYDAVAIWNTFEQLDDPRAAAAHAATLLRPGGILVVRVPNGEWYARWRARLGGPAAPVARALLAHNNLLGFPYRHGFTVATLSSLLGGTGFEIEATHGDALVPVADRFTRRWARLEERLLKGALRWRARVAPAEHSPWIEVYAARR